MSAWALSIESLLHRIVENDAWHARWLNTLSFLENCGARKIAACEHPTLVKEEMLKHAAEEFRHAHHLKAQMKKLSSRFLDTYALGDMWGGMATLHYLDRLEVEVSRYCRSFGCMKAFIYPLVTYAIECRAGKLYPLYDRVLRHLRSRVTVKSILLEEEEHLQEMGRALEGLPGGAIHRAHVCAIEEGLSQRWLRALVINK